MRSSTLIVLVLGSVATLVGCGGSSPTVAAAKASSAEFKQLVDQGLEELRIKTAAFDATWQISTADWSVDQDVGTIVFENAGGMKATCPVQIIGTYSLDDGTFMWGWDHPSVDTKLQENAKKMKDYGVAKKLPALTTQKIRCTEEEAWELTAAACKLCGAQGAYGGKSDPTRIYMTFGEVTLSK